MGAARDGCLHKSIGALAPSSSGLPLLLPCLHPCPHHPLLPLCTNPGKCSPCRAGGQGPEARPASHSSPQLVDAGQQADGSVPDVARVVDEAVPHLHLHIPGAESNW